MYAGPARTPRRVTGYQQLALRDAGHSMPETAPELEVNNFRPGENTPELGQLEAHSFEYGTIDKRLIM